MNISQDPHEQMLNIALNGETGRVEAEHFIHDVFMHQYGANIQSYLPWIISVIDKDRSIICALGLNDACSNTLFLEQYLDKKIEEIATNTIGVDINRQDIIEVGNLAVNSLVGARQLIHILTAFLRGAGYKWVAFTAPPLLINSFKKLNLHPYYLADAKFDYLSDNKTDWGRYYKNNPQVVIGNVDAAYEILKSNPNRRQVGVAMMWRRAYTKGRMYRVLNDENHHNICNL